MVPRSRYHGELDEADQFIEAAEKCRSSEQTSPEARSMHGLLAYVKSRVTAMRGDLHHAIVYCLAARELVPANNLALRLDACITLGYEYFMNGDFANASPVLNETIKTGLTANAVINPVAASCVLARIYAIQGMLHRSYDTYQTATQFLPKEGGEHVGSKALVEIGIADLLVKWNDLEAALTHINQGLALLPSWGKADDYARST